MHRVLVEVLARDGLDHHPPTLDLVTEPKQEAPGVRADQVGAPDAAVLPARSLDSLALHGLAVVGGEDAGLLLQVLVEVGLILLLVPVHPVETADELLDLAEAAARVRRLDEPQHLFGLVHAGFPLQGWKNLSSSTIEAIIH